MTTEAAGCPRVSEAWTAGRTATAKMSGSACGRTALVPHGLLAWPTRPDADHALLPGSGPWPAEVAVPDPCPATHSPSPPRLPQGPHCVRAVAGRREAARHPSKGSDRRGHQHGHLVQPVRILPDTYRPDGGRSGSSGRSTADRSGSLQLPLLFLQGRPRPTGTTGGTRSGIGVGDVASR
jgi:hypothetical protein